MHCEKKVSHLWHELHCCECRRWDCGLRSVAFSALSRSLFLSRPGTRLQCPPLIRTLLRLDHNSFRDARDVPGDLDQGVWLLREEHLTHLTLATRTDGQDSTLGKAKSLLFATDTGRKMLEMLVMIQAQVPMARGTYSIGEDV